MRARPAKTTCPIRLLAGWCGLLLYVGAFSPIGMMAGGILGTLDPDHHALFLPSASGMRLVLHHEGNCARHKHHCAARVLTLFAQPASATDPDHVVQFAGGDAVWRGSANLVSAEATECGQHLGPDNLPYNDPAAFEPEPPSTGPPPDIVGNLLNVRFTVLLI